MLIVWLILKQMMKLNRFAFENQGAPIDFCPRIFRSRSLFEVFAGDFFFEWGRCKLGKSFNFMYLSYMPFFLFPWFKKNPYLWKKIPSEKKNPYEKNPIVMKKITIDKSNPWSGRSKFSFSKNRNSPIKVRGWPGENFFRLIVVINFFSHHNIQCSFPLGQGFRECLGECLELPRCAWIRHGFQAYQASQEVIFQACLNRPTRHFRNALTAQLGISGMPWQPN